MFPASTKGGGQCAAFPDVCKVPAPPAPFVPTPFPNLSQCSGGDSVSEKVMIVNKPTIHTSSELSRSSGDEAGTLKGMISSTNMDKAVYKMGSSAVSVEGKDLCSVLKPSSQNGSNSNAPPGAQVAPGQTKVILMR